MSSTIDVLKWDKKQTDSDIKNLQGGHCHIILVLYDEDSHSAIV